MAGLGPVGSSSGPFGHGPQRPQGSSSMGKPSPSSAAKPTFAVLLKSPLVKKTKEVRVPVGGRVKDLKRAVWKEFGQQGIIVMLGARELKDGSEPLSTAGIVPGVTVSVVNRITSGLVGNLDHSVDSEDSDRSKQGPVGGPVVTGNFFFPMGPMGPMGGMGQYPGQFGHYPMIEAPKPAPPPPTSSEEKARQATAASKTKAKMAALLQRKKDKAAKPPVAATNVHCATSSQVSEKSLTESEREEDVPAAASSQTTQSAPTSPVAGAFSPTCASPSAEPPKLLKPDNCVLAPLDKLECRCGQRYCKKHRDPAKHKCAYDYKKAARRKIARDNPSPARGGI